MPKLRIPGSYDPHQSKADQEALKTEGVRYIGLREDAEKRIHELTRGPEGTGKP